MENLSDTYHDPSQRVPKNYYWNADPKKKTKLFYLGGIYYCAANINIVIIYHYIFIYIYC